VVIAARRRDHRSVIEGVDRAPFAAPPATSTALKKPTDRVRPEPSDVRIPV